MEEILNTYQVRRQFRKMGCSTWVIDCNEDNRNQEPVYISHTDGLHTYKYLGNLRWSHKLESR